MTTPNSPDVEAIASNWGEYLRGSLEDKLSVPTQKRYSFAATKKAK